jgi:hypothetical protein
MDQQESLSDEKAHPMFEIGQTILLESDSGTTREHTVLNISDTSRIAQILGLDYSILNPIPVLILSGDALQHQAAYHPELNVILIYNDTIPRVVHHELIHSLEYHKPIPDELVQLYNTIKQALPDTQNIQPNFRKDIHEFIADAYSKPGLINTLTEHGLYDEFLRLTKYIFD